MIWESGPWKVELFRRLTSLRRRKTQRRWPVSSTFGLERDAFVSAYIVRKLREANKLSNEVEGISIRVADYGPPRRAVDFMNWDKLNQLYDLESHGHINIGLMDLANELIHSFVFVPVLNEHRGLEEFFVASDIGRRKRLLCVPLDAYTDALERVSRDNIVSMSAKRNPATGELEIDKKSSRAARP